MCTLCNVDVASANDRMPSTKLATFFSVNASLIVGEKASNGVIGVALPVQQRCRDALLLGYGHVISVDLQQLLRVVQQIGGEMAQTRRAFGRRQIGLQRGAPRRVRKRNG